MEGTALTTNEVAIPAGRDLVIPNDADYAVMSYDELMGMDSLRIQGLTLISKEEMLGIPHIITRVTYWTPKKDQKGMVSVEATVGGIPHLERAIQRGWVPNVERIEQLRLDPNERVVYNDGGTGIRRQLTMMLESLKLIDVGDNDNQSPERFDRPWPEWTEFAETRYQSKDTGDVPSFSRHTDANGTERALIIRCDRGLYLSAYSNEYTDEGETFYLR
jgi:hypothetical protein